MNVVKPTELLVSADTLKLAEALGWKQHKRLGRDVWYDPTGGHVLPHELKEELEDALDNLIAEAGEPLPADLAALKNSVTRS